MPAIPQYKNVLGLKFCTPVGGNHLSPVIKKMPLIHNFRPGQPVRVDILINLRVEHVIGMCVAIEKSTKETRQRGGQLCLVDVVVKNRVLSHHNVPVDMIEFQGRFFSQVNIVRANIIS